MRAAALALALLVLGAGGAQAAPATPPAPTRWVTDQVGFLSPGTRASLDARLEAYERASGHHVLVWIAETLGDDALDDFATRTFEAWRVGRQGDDDGLVVFVLAGDRKVAIEVGYGLEDRVPDAIAHRIIDEAMAPRIRAGDRDGALVAAVDAITTAIDGAPFASDGARPAVAPRPARRSPIGLFVLGGIFLVLLVFNPRLAMYFLWSIAASGRRGRDGDGGGGGWSGGGGRSGGGGARGGW